MTYRLRRADLEDEDDRETLRFLHDATFGDSAFMPDFTYGAWWLVYSTKLKNPIAFCGVVQSLYHPTHAYLKRVGVMKRHRGRGLQKRLLRVRERWARRNNFKVMITDATAENTHSANNLIAAGYRVFDPVGSHWGLPNAIYFKKRLAP